MKSMRYVLSLSMLLSAPIVAMNDTASVEMSPADMEARANHEQWLTTIQLCKDSLALHMHQKRLEQIKEHKEKFGAQIQTINIDTTQPHIQAWHKDRAKLAKNLDEAQAKKSKNALNEISNLDQLLAYHEEIKSKEIASSAAIAALTKAESVAAKLPQKPQANTDATSWDNIKSRVKGIKVAKKAAAAKGTSWLFGSSTAEGETSKPKSTTTVKASPEVSDCGLSSLFSANNAIGNAFSRINDTVAPINKALADLLGIIKNPVTAHENKLINSHIEVAAKEEWMKKAGFLAGNIVALDLTSNEELVKNADKLLEHADHVVAAAILQTFKEYTAILNWHSELRSNLHKGAKPTQYLDIAQIIELEKAYEKAQTQK